MIGSLIKKIVGSKNERELKKIQPLVDKINQLESKISPLSDDRLLAKTSEFKERIESPSMRSSLKLLPSFARQRNGPLAKDIMMFS
jgi:preprotein translocase subunit SecA